MIEEEEPLLSGGELTADQLESMIQEELRLSVPDTQQKGKKKTKLSLPPKLFLFPVHSRPLFPGMAAPYQVEEGPFLEAVKEIAHEEHKTIGLFLTRQRGKLSSPLSIDDIYDVGVAAKILRIIPHTPQEGKSGAQLILNVEHRIRIKKFIPHKQTPRADVTYFPEEIKASSKWLRAYTMSIVTTIKELVKLNPVYKEELQIFLGHHEFTNPGRLCDFAVSLTTATREELQDILAAFDLEERALRALSILKKELNIAKLQSSITDKIETTLSKSQREYFLKEQLRTIKKELGLEKDEKSCDVARFEERLSKCTVPDAVMETIRNEMDKFSSLDPSSAEYSVCRHYLDWLTYIPWGIQSEDLVNLAHAKKVLDEDHYGLEDVKERILEFISIGRLTKRLKGSILCLMGPPGVGKTSIGASIARALGRKFFRFSVGGMSDEAEIRGHRRTYVGAMPGKFIQGLKYCQTMNPVILIDEIDKMGNSMRGDPASALLEVLDPEQNTQFLDHYLDVHCDLSEVLFIVTANVLETIPEPLRDRMEILRLSGYMTDEKMQIASGYLIPKLRKETGLGASQVAIAKPVLKTIIQSYAREAGVRSLEAALKKILRKCAHEVVKEMESSSDQQSTPSKRITITQDNLQSYLGLPRFTPDRFLKKNPPGVVVGLAWTAMGGSTLYIETLSCTAEKSLLKLTGQAGDVMKESSQIAWTFVHSRFEKYRPGKPFFKKQEVHMHIPEGAVPKDGPSAGITMATALFSLLLKKSVPSHIGMTGELTLTGAILPIGGVREKFMAAIREGITTVILPEKNRRDVKELPEDVYKGLTLHFVSHYDELFSLLFEGARS